MTYNKPKKTIEVIGRHGIDVTLADGDSSSSASYAFAEFMRDDAMHIKVADITEGGSSFSGADSVIVPYHEVGAVVVDMSASSVTRPNPYGCEAGGEDTVNITFVGDDERIVLDTSALGYKVDGECFDSETARMLKPLESNPLKVKEGKAFKLPECYAYGDIFGFALDGVGYDPGDEYTATEDTTFIVQGGQG